MINTHKEKKKDCYNYGQKRAQKQKSEGFILATGINTLEILDKNQNCSARDMNQINY